MKIIIAEYSAEEYRGSSTFREIALSKTNASKRYDVKNDFISVTDFISVFEKPFEREMIATTAFKYNKNPKLKVPKDLMYMWDLHGEIARSWGTAFHGVIESTVKYGTRVKNTIFDGWLDKFEELFPNLDALQSEVELRSEDLKIVGRIDLINVIDKEKKIADLIDTKTYSDPKKKATYLKNVYKVATKKQEFKTALQLLLYKKIMEEQGWTIRKIQILLQDGFDLVLKDLENNDEYIDRLFELIDTNISNLEK